MYRQFFFFFLLIFAFAGCRQTAVSPLAVSTPHPFFADPVETSDAEAVSGESLFTELEPTAVPEMTAEAETLAEESAVVEVETAVTASDDQLRVPILTYHHISETASSEIDNNFFVSPSVFEQHMAYLADNGYTPIDLDTLTIALGNTEALPNNPVVLTFDDGYTDNYENAFPVLQSFGFTGTFFVITDFANQELDGYMNWEMLKEMSEAGMQIESHTSNHADLRDRTADELMAEIRASQEAIANNVGQTASYLAYPKGNYDSTVLEVLDELAFSGAVTDSMTAQDDYKRPFELPRLAIRHNMPVSEFGSLVTFADLPLQEGQARSNERLVKHTLYDDTLAADWHVTMSDDASIDLDDNAQPYTGSQAAAIRLAEPGEAVFLRVNEEAVNEYRRDQVFGLAFWLYSGNGEVDPDDISVTVLGSNAYPYWLEGDESLTDQPINTFSGTRLYGLDFERPLPAQTWIRVEIILDELQFDPLYESEPDATSSSADRERNTILDPDFEFVTGFAIKAENELKQTIYLDDLQPLLLTQR